MKPLLNPGILLPIGIIILQTFILLCMVIYFLKWIKVIKAPFAGIEYSAAIFVVSILFAVLFISAASVSATFQTYATYQEQRQEVFELLIVKASHFFLVVLFFEALLALIIILCLKAFPWLGKGIKELENGNIPFAMFIGIVCIGASIILKSGVEEMINYITPHYLNFR